MRGRWLGLLMFAVLGCSTPEVRQGVVYDARHATGVMDVYLPAGGGAARPGVMLIHGGAWRGGDRGHFEAAARRLADSGYVAATIDYRLVPAAFPAEVQDCLCALAFLRAHAADYGLDPARVAVMGYSAGSHLASLVGVAAERDELAPDCAAGRTGPPAAVIAGSGAYDLRTRRHQWVEDFMGGTPEELPELYALASPITHVRPGLPPVLLIQGEDDWIAAPEQAAQMRAALQGAGVFTRLLTLDGGGHLLNAGADNGQWFGEMVTESPEAWAVVIDFLDRTIGSEAVQ